MNLTNERLKEICESPFDAGDDEIDRMLVGIANDALLSRGVKETFVRLDEEIERLKSKLEHKSQQVDSQVSLVSEIERLKVEKIEDAARRVSKLRRIMNEDDSEIATLTAERDEARKELAALRKAPGMEEVDSMGKSAMETLAQIVRDRPETNRPAIDTVPAGRYAKLRDLIDAMLATCCRSIAAREEVVGLLKHILSCIITVKQENTPEWMEYIAEEVNKINEAIGDPDRVVVNCCDIVIVRGKSEIVEGK